MLSPLLSLLPFLFNYPPLSRCGAGTRQGSMPWPTAGSQQPGKRLREGELCPCSAGRSQDRSPPAPVTQKPPYQAKIETGQVQPHCSVESRPLSEHKPGTCWIRPHAPPKPGLCRLPAGGSALRGLRRLLYHPLPAGKELPYLCRHGRAGLPCLSAIGGLPGAYQFIRGQKTLSRRVLRQCERLIRNSPPS